MLKTVSLYIKMSVASLCAPYFNIYVFGTMALSLFTFSRLATLSHYIVARVHGKLTIYGITSCSLSPLHELKSSIFIFYS